MINECYQFSSIRLIKSPFLLISRCNFGATGMKQGGCRVYAVDKRESMIALSKKYAQQAGLLDKIDFRVADALDLPFEDDMFDAVIMESVNILIENKETAFREYFRVLKQSGILVINEITWLKTPPEDLRKVTYTLTNNIDTLNAEEWEALFNKMGFRNVAAEISVVDAKKEVSSGIRHIGWKRIFSSLGKTVKLYFSNPDFRRLMKTVGGSISDGISQHIEYMGYGLYSGKK